MQRLPVSSITERRLRRLTDTSLHEVFTERVVKLFADVDVYISSRYTAEDFERDMHDLRFRVEAVFGALTLTHASYTDCDRISYHLVWNVLVDLDI